MHLLRPASLTLLLLCAIDPVAEVLHREVTLGLLILLGLLDAGRGMADADSATEQLGGFLRRLASLAVWPFHAAVFALAFLGLSAHEHGAEKRLVPVCATCSGSGSSGCGSGGGGCGASGGGKCGCGSGKAAAAAVKPSAAPAPATGGTSTRASAPPVLRGADPRLPPNSGFMTPVQKSGPVPAPGKAAAQPARPASGTAPLPLPSPSSRTAQPALPPRPQAPAAKSAQPAPQNATPGPRQTKAGAETPAPSDGK